MSQSFIYIQQIQQEDAHSFTILWSDQLLQRFRLGEVQRCCPCAGCAAKKGEPPVQALQDEVKATRIASVGRYAIKITFTKGCSTGIYDFELLRKIGQNVQGEH